MRRRSLLLAAPVGLLSLAGCGDDSSGSDRGSPSAGTESPSSPPKATIVSGPLPEVTAGTGFGQKPTVAKGTGKPSGNLAVRTLIPGSGTAVGAGTFPQVNYLGQIWSTGKVFDNSYDRGRPSVFQIGVSQVIQGWDQGLVGKKEGSRVELAIPPELGYGEDGRPESGIQGTDTLVFVVDIVHVFTEKDAAKGRTVRQSDPALPRVGTKSDGRPPSITVPRADPPKKLVADYVIEGDGPKVKETDGVLVQYRGLLWDGGKEFDSSYAGGRPTALYLQRVGVKGWAQGLTGKKVGSRVLLVVPPSLGYGKDGYQGVPGNATLVYSVDILALL
ncbi:FKBP-type peptidyl-prolyl cis-trans isomerase [Streptomyces sp. B1866]|uniref:FKBP-type peptidyl-prolyl cis-trans isomerase n=1 Tax=Streptomyces sp. B1866 TaxID=3075431 RepID=UPI00288CDED6|nr:FKBP-type peptidyl-prolyl cis-trans isomerase [Streptomyces sp. B1866]MDT3396690.1 FKBP-type peptidyl-prolyl cis-trans isomerase [Streptomyces sp. B1866]